ncbi:hypothetical protein NCER_100494 [Vairimorpha ceranae BRL01]|uniref:Pre-mRNA cleavage complex 2 protein Pcf11 n=2 Tax=Vairimorpha ceranae TaxID=40302 RepID=C4V7Q7_VAIC1|nr:pre-mrna cleavage complex 2 protein pcf11 [Vairimorpha ceranae]EEQ82748.1 hypothetical protein NCER_100494 [Vairimorpha ceranae BRL01]KAF5140186.1 hypothetical protein G9O61_00g016510 [Vairimorpha ceranae]KKO75154.1 pre-mrna cleavage complex 2 protein pcf11 [Vairimorpha ceranae]
MKEIINLLKSLQKGDKIRLNVLIMISVSQARHIDPLGKIILAYYKDCSNKEAIRWFLETICEKDENYLEFFSRYSKIFEGVNDKLSYLLRDYKKVKRVKYHESTPSEIKTNIVNKEVIKGKHNEPALHSILYEKIQCKLCGLRYKENDPSYDVHIEDHMRKNRARNEKDVFSREYFSTFDGWIKNMERITLNLKIDKIEKVIYKGGTVHCKVCGNKIEALWDEEEDEFVLNECVQLDEDEYCHKACVI